MLPEFVEFAGSKGYQCPKCRADIRYAKFFGDDKKLLTTDGKEPNKKFGRDSNTGWAADPITKQIHECKPKTFPESALKKTDTLDKSINPQNTEALTKFDKVVIDRIIQDAYERAKFLIWKLQGVEKACDELGIDRGAVSGMVYKEVCAEDRRLEQNGE